ncbi:ATP-binding protein [Paraglaciecola sp. 2405UD69-4]|uniref:ATP-binding protein n=1 Tax=Paraglaciecola sp. 2405UD69-4 TaxID=3391836 RepID=UPI0039C9F771
MNIEIEANDLKDRQKTLHEVINNLIEKLPEESATRKQLANHLELFDDAVSYLSNSDQRLAFIGNVGTGKTTAICHLLGLLHGDEPILSTGSGRTTLCEVEIAAGSQLRVEVTPHTEAELKSYLSDFAQYLHASDIAEADNSESFKLSAEVERALRNMLNLRISRTKNPEGKRITTDSAKNFAADYQSIESLTDVLMERIDFPSRHQTLFTNDTELDQNQWLHSTFKAINSCTYPSVGLPKHIRILVPVRLFEHINYALSVIDTKGVDQTVNRADLDGCLTDNRTVSVLCCRFNEAPDKTMTGLLKLAKDAGLSQRVAKETVLLILDRESEAEKVIDIDEPVGDKIEGREIRAEQVVNDLKHTLQFDNLDVQFFDVKSDDPKQLRKLLAEKVSVLRGQYAQDIFDIEKAISDIETELVSQSARAAKNQVKNTLEAWIKKAQGCSPSLKEYFLPLVNDIKNKGTYAASVRASVNRRGEWHNLDYYQLLAAGSREQVVDQIGTLKDEFIVLIDNMLSQNELQPAYALLKQLKQTTEKRLGDIYQKAFAKGRAVYENNLSSDNQFWNDLFKQWGKGPGYKARVSGNSETWFHTRKYPEFESSVTRQVAEEWGLYVNEVRDMLGYA